jgi:FAD/FMN-containing dehydrogenase
MMSVFTRKGEAFVPVDQSSVLIQDLRATLDGGVVGPDDVGYDQLRMVFPGGVDCRPAAIIRAQSANDVRQTVSRVRESGLDLAVRSGGHSVHSTTDGGVVLDLRDIKGLEVDVAARTVWAGSA